MHNSLGNRNTWTSVWPFLAARWIIATPRRIASSSDRDGLESSSSRPFSLLHCAFAQGPAAFSASAFAIVRGSCRAVGITCRLWSSCLRSSWLAPFNRSNLMESCHQLAWRSFQARHVPPLRCRTLSGLVPRNSPRPRGGASAQRYAGHLRVPLHRPTRGQRHECYAEKITDCATIAHRIRKSRRMDAAGFKGAGLGVRGSRRSGGRG